MQIVRNKKVAIAIVAMLIMTMSTTIVLLPNTSAHSPPWNIISYAYIVATPNPVGVGQKASVMVWVDAPIPSAAVGNDIRRHDYALTITKPDGTIETKTWPVVYDTTGIQFFQYTPTQIGTYALKFDYPGQTYTWSGVYQNDTFTAASASHTLTVTQTQVSPAIDSYPLPVEYWTRPIEGQNTYWYTISSNWLGSPYILGAAASYGIPGAYQPDGAAPNSPHVMWTKPIQYGGIVGGSDTAILGEMYYQGGSYNVRYSNPIIMQGTLFYQEPYGNSAGGGDYVAVDLQTGAELWRINTSATGVSLVPSFGYLYSYESPNQHGVLPNGLLIATQGGGFGGGATTWRAYDPRTGYLTSMNITNVPSGTNVAGPLGEYLKYTVTNLGNSTNPNWRLMQWNSSNVFGGGAGLSPANWYSGNVPANTPITPGPSGTNTNWNGSMWVNSTVRAAQGYAAISTPAYDWNVSVSLGPGTWSVGTASLGAIPLVSVNNMLLLIQGSFGGHVGDFGGTVTSDPANITAISLKPGSLGQVLWTKSYPPAPGNNTRFLTGWDLDNGVFVFDDKESMSNWGYSLTDGSYMWGPTVLPNDFTVSWNFLALGLENVAYGKLYLTGYSGILYAFDIKTGKLLWTYGNGGEGNSTLSGLNTPWGRYPTFISTIADGKIYLDTTEHSPNSPLYKGAMYRAINATDGTEIWTLMGYGNQMYGGQQPIADGYMAFLNTYDSRIYSIGKGPSALTVTAPEVAVASGTPIVIKGAVTDIAAGTKQPEQAARFPNGVPAVSDESMGEWSAYVYMQKPKPTDVTGVKVKLTATDPNGEIQNIGTVTSDASGGYAVMWTPTVTGLYTVTALFEGTDSFWPSQATTYFGVGAAAAPIASPTPTQTIAPTATPTTAPTATPTTAPNPTGSIAIETYIAIAAVIIIAIIAAAALVLRRRK